METKLELAMATNSNGTENPEPEPSQDGGQDGGGGNEDSPTLVEPGETSQRDDAGGQARLSLVESCDTIAASDRPSGKR